MKKRIFLILVTALMTVTSAFAQNRELQIFRSGSIIQSFPVSNIDSIKVGYAFNAPSNVTARLDNKNIIVTWSTVSGAQSYQVYRSGDGKNYVLLAGNITKTTYTDTSPLTNTNYYKVKTTGQGGESLLSTASAPVTFNDDNGLEKGLYMGIIGFNEDLIDKGDMGLLAPNTKGTFTSFVNSLTTKKNTVLYYAVDKALDKLTTTPFPNNLRNVAIVTFTDGLDQGSLPMINYDPYVTKTEYRTYLDGRIKSTTVQGLSLSAYTIGLRGGDVTNYGEFQNNLVSLASSEENAMEVTNMSEVNSRFQEIANQLTDITETQIISIKFPMLDDGQTFRFIFDNVIDATQSQCYIEGTMNVRNNTLNNIRYVGLTCSSGTSIQGTRYGINISFDFVNLKDANGNNLSLDYVKEFYLEGSYWQVNSEFDKGDDIEVTVERSSAAIMLVLDCSSSLQSDGDKFTEMKSHVKAFIETLAEAMNNVELEDLSGSIDGHDYVDLGLPSRTLWATCNIGATKPEAYGNYYAWGETTTKSNYSWSTYKYCKGSNNTLTKYCTLSSNGYNGFTDGIKTLLPEDDAATVNWGSNWRMPRASQFAELIDTTYTTTIWTTLNGVYGRKITSKINGNSIFLPAAGYRENTTTTGVGTRGDYWSTLLCTSDPNDPDTYVDKSGVLLEFRSGKIWIAVISTGRRTGMVIRPVRVQN